jgi:hypothetical protein
LAHVSQSGLEPLERTSLRKRPLGEKVVGTDDDTQSRADDLDDLLCFGTTALEHTPFLETADSLSEPRFECGPPALERRLVDRPVRMGVDGHAVILGKEVGDTFVQIGSPSIAHQG